MSCFFLCQGVWLHLRCLQPFFLRFSDSHAQASSYQIKPSSPNSAANVVGRKVVTIFIIRYDHQYGDKLNFIKKKKKHLKIEYNQSKTITRQLSFLAVTMIYTYLQKNGDDATGNANGSKNPDVFHFHVGVITARSCLEIRTSRHF